MNAKVLSVLMVLVLVNNCIGLPLEIVVNTTKSAQVLSESNNTVNAGYYGCWTVCVNGRCVQHCS